MIKRLSASLLLLTLSFANAESLDSQEIKDFYLKNGQSCADCKVISGTSSFIGWRYDMTGIYTRLVSRGIAGGDSLQVQRPDGTTTKISLKSLQKEVLKPEKQTHTYNLSTFTGNRYKDIYKTLVDYNGEYAIFQTKDGEKVTVPLKDIEFLVNANTGELLYNGNTPKETIAGYIEQQQRMSVASRNLYLMNQLNQFNQTMTRQQQANQTTNYINAYTQMNRGINIPPTVNKSSTTINCNTVGPFTNCTGW